MADSTASSKVHNARHCKLLSIGAELRNRIYNEVFKDSTVHLSSSYKFPPLLRTCRTINNEATQLYHANTTFTYRDSEPHPPFSKTVPAITQWIAKLPLRSRNAIHAIRYDNPKLIRCLDEEIEMREVGLGHHEGMKRRRYLLGCDPREVEWELRGLELSQMAMPWLGPGQMAWEWRSLSEIVKEVGCV